MRNPAKLRACASCEVGKMNVKELILFLEAIEDKDAEVMVIEHKSGTGYYDQGGSAREVFFDEKVHIEYTDFRGNRFVHPKSDFYNKRYLLIGAKDL